MSSLVFHCLSLSNPSCCRFSELAVRSPVEAISFLQVQLASLVDHSNKQESAEVNTLYIYSLSISLILSLSFVSWHLLSLVPHQKKPGKVRATTECFTLVNSLFYTS